MTFIKTLKSKHLVDFQESVRSIISRINPYVFPASIAANGAFFLYSVIKAISSDVHPLWFVSLSFWYFLMMLGKIQLLFGNGRMDAKTQDMRAANRTRFFVIAAGILIIALSVQVYFFSFEVALSIPFVVLNGSYVTVKLVLRLFKSTFSKGNKRKSDVSLIDECRQKLATAESMFAFSLIFYKLIAAYNWEDSMLSLMAMVYGGISGMVVILVGLRYEKAL